MAFPTTGIIDDFNRASLGANWSADPGNQGSGNLTKPNATQVSGVSGDFGESYWNVSTYGPDSEAFVTIATRPGNTETVALWLRVQSPDSASASGYYVEYTQQSGTDTVIIYRVNNAVFAPSLVTFSQEFANGDRLGAEVVGTGSTVTIRAYRFASGAWSLVGSYDDTSADRITSAGYIGLTVTHTTGRADDFGGGTVVAGDTPISGSDSGTLALTASLSATPAATDATSLAEVASLSGTTAANDSSTLGDASSLSVQPAASDSGSLADGASLQAQPSITDSASTSDSSNLAVATVSGDGAALTESAGIATGAADAGALADTGMLSAGAGTADAWHLTDAGMLSVGAGTADAWHLTDAGALAVSLSASDGGTLTESSSTDAGSTPITAGEAGTLGEVASLAADLGRADGAALTEAAGIQVILEAADVATLADVAGPIRLTADDAGVVDSSAAALAALVAGDAAALGEDTRVNTGAAAVLRPGSVHSPAGAGGVRGPGGTGTTEG